MTFKVIISLERYIITYPTRCFLYESLLLSILFILFNYTDVRRQRVHSYQLRTLNLLSDHAQLVCLKFTIYSQKNTNQLLSKRLLLF